jgi:hypothetical protein
LNLHGLPHWILSPARLPFRHSRERREMYCSGFGGHEEHQSGSPGRPVEPSVDWTCEPEQNWFGPAPTTSRTADFLAARESGADQNIV